MLNSDADFNDWDAGENHVTYTYLDLFINVAFNVILSVHLDTCSDS